MRILIATDAFPPASGGSGWSTYELARGLRARGHEIVVVQPYSERTPVPSGYDGFDVSGFPAFAPAVPYLRNYVRNERLYRRLAAYLRNRIETDRIDLVHAQHVLTGPPSIAAARRAGIPVVCTVRDYWPLCYWSDHLENPKTGKPCPGCSTAAMTRCVRPRAGSAWPLTLPMIPYMRANLRHKQASLAEASAIVAVSNQVAEDLRHRSPALSASRIETIPNGLDVAGVRARAIGSIRPLSEPYALFVGKLARNKGAQWLVETADRARLDMPLVVIGDGSERPSIVESAAATKRDVRVLGWLDRQDVFRWLAHASLLVFPSNCPETLSRVLIEASALSVPIAAMNTGGTSDIITHDQSGLLSTSVAELAEDVARLVRDPQLRARLGKGAARTAAARFDTRVVIDRMEALYQSLVA